MSDSVSSAGYVPRYPVPDNLPDAGIRAFITNFYSISDRPDANELWVKQFTSDARVVVGPKQAKGEEGEFQ